MADYGCDSIFFFTVGSLVFYLKLFTAIKNTVHQLLLQVKLYPADQIDALIYDVNQKTVAKVIKHRDVTIVNSTILVINLRDFVRDYVKKYRLIAQRLVTSDPEDFCVSEPRIQYADFVMASERG